MDDWYTRQGAYTGQTYLIVVEESGMQLFFPGSFSLPFMSLGLSWSIGAGRNVGSGWWGHARALRRIRRREREIARRDRATARRRRFTERRAR